MNNQFVSEQKRLIPTNLEDYVHKHIDVSWERCSGCERICEDFGGVCPIVDVKFVTLEQVKMWLQQKLKEIINDLDWTTNNLTKIGAKRAIGELLGELE